MLRMFIQPALDKRLLIRSRIFFEGLPQGLGHTRLIETMSAFDDNLGKVLATLAADWRANLAQ